MHTYIHICKYAHIHVVVGACVLDKHTDPVLSKLVLIQKNTCTHMHTYMHITCILDIYISCIYNNR